MSDHVASSYPSAIPVVRGQSTLVNIAAIIAQTRHRAGLDTENETALGRRNRCLYTALQLTVILEISFGSILAIIGLSGISAELGAASRLLAGGLVQALIATPGALAMQWRHRHFWQIYFFAQLSVGTGEAFWILEAIRQSRGDAIVIMTVLTVLQMWSAFASMSKAKLGTANFWKASRKASEAGFAGFGSPGSSQCQTPKNASIRVQVESETASKDAEERLSRANKSLKRLVDTSSNSLPSKRSSDASRNKSSNPSPLTTSSSNSKGKSKKRLRKKKKTGQQKPGKKSPKKASPVKRAPRLYFTNDSSSISLSEEDLQKNKRDSGSANENSREEETQPTQ